MVKISKNVWVGDRSKNVRFVVGSSRIARFGWNALKSKVALNGVVCFENSAKATSGNLIDNGAAVKVIEDIRMSHNIVINPPTVKLSNRFFVKFRLLNMRFHSFLRFSKILHSSGCQQLVSFRKVKSINTITVRTTSLEAMFMIFSYQ